MKRRITSTDQFVFDFEIRPNIYAGEQHGFVGRITLREPYFLNSTNFPEQSGKDLDGIKERLKETADRWSEKQRAYWAEVERREQSVIHMRYVV